MVDNVQCPEGLFVLTDYRILLCLYCKAGIRPGKAVENHWRNVHYWTGCRLQKALAYVATQTLQDPHTIRMPAQCALIPQLPTFPGYSCSGCNYLTRSRKCRERHDREQSHPESESGWAQVRLQTFSNGRYAQYWTVQDEDEGPQEDDTDYVTSTSGSLSGNEAWAQMVARQQQRDEERRQKHLTEVDNPEDLGKVSTWVKEMGWAAHFDGKNPLLIHDASMLPTMKRRRGAGSRRLHCADESREWQEQLIAAGESVERVIAKCCERLTRVPHETLRWLNGIDPVKAPMMPFKVKSSGKSMLDYRSYVKRYLVYCLRTGRLPCEEAQTTHGIEFTPEQRRLLDHIRIAAAEVAAAARLPSREVDEDGEDHQERCRVLDRAVFEFWIASWKQNVAFRVHVNPLLHFAAVLGIRELGGWVDASSFTSMLAGLMWCGRVAMLEHIFETLPDDPTELTTSHMEHFFDQYRRWLVDGTHTPFSTIVRWMAYGKGYREKTGGQAKVTWDQDGLGLRYLGQPIALKDFGQAIQAGLDETSRLLDQLLFEPWATAAKRIDLRRIQDSLIYQGPDHSFATNQRNRWLRPGWEFLAERARAMRGWWSPQTGWNRAKVQTYLRWVKGFPAIQPVTNHLWSGQPGRGPEVMEMLYCDVQQVSGNVKVIDGQVVFITDRDKSRAIRGLGRKVARWLPASESQKMIAYIAWVIPFEQHLLVELGLAGVDDSLTPYLWKDARYGLHDTAALSAGLAQLFGTHTGVELGVSAYRHFAITLARKIKGIVVRQVEVEIGERGVDDSMGGDQVTGAPQKKAKLDYIWDLQATPGSELARLRYALDAQFPSHLQPEMMGQYREISGMWHQFLWGLVRAASDFNEPIKRSRTGGDVVDGARPTKRLRDEGSVSAGSIQQGLRQLFGPTARWKSAEQGQAVERVMAMKAYERLIVVLPTGGGKSPLFMLPTILPGREGGTTVVVVPFAALIRDVVRRARECKIDCIRWQSASTVGRDGPERQARLVVVSADLVEVGEFVQYLDHLRRLGVLKEIFVDECHTVVLDVGYRDRLLQLTGMNRYDCAMIFLTATLPGFVERRVRQTMLIEDAAIIRASTVKGNIRYQVQETSRSGDVDKMVEKAVGRLGARMIGDQKGVVYCRTHAEAERMAERVQCEFYHSGIAEARRRQEILEGWMNGVGGIRWIVATTGLGTGIDIAGIVGVVHMGAPYGLVDFVQQTGRGGRRDGEVVDSVIIKGPGRAVIRAQASDVEHWNHEAMVGFIEHRSCRRVMLGEIMDGRGQSCVALGVEQCDRCQGEAGSMEGDGAERAENEETNPQSPSHVVSGSERLKEHVQSTHRALHRLRGWLNEVRDYCPVCWVKWHRRGRQERHRRLVEHGIQQCPVVGYSAFRAWRRELRFGEYDCCWRCGLAGGWCDGAERGLTCEYADRVLPVMMEVVESETGRKWVREALEVSDEVLLERSRYLLWLGRRRQVYGGWMTNGMAVVATVVTQCDRQYD